MRAAAIYGLRNAVSFIVSVVGTASNMSAVFHILFDDRRAIFMLQHNREVLLLINSYLADSRAPIAREYFVVRVNVTSLVCLRVKVRTVYLLAALSVLHPALVVLIVIGVVLLLLPAVAAVTAVLEHAAVVISLRVFPRLPI